MYSVVELRSLPIGLHITGVIYLIIVFAFYFLVEKGRHHLKGRSPFVKLGRPTSQVAITDPWHTWFLMVIDSLSSSDHSSPDSEVDDITLDVLPTTALPAAPATGHVSSSLRKSIKKGEPINLAKLFLAFKNFDSSLYSSTIVIV